MRNILLASLLFCGLFCSSQTTKKTAQHHKADTTVKPATWQYGTDTDKMTDAVSHFASLDAIGKVFFESPYDGGSTPFLFIQNVNSINLFAFRVPKGRFTENPSGKVSLRVRFDEEQPNYYKFYTPDNNTSAAVVKLSSANKLIERLKRSKRVRIEATFDKGGDAVVEFHTAGLKWDYKGKEDDTTKHAGTDNSGNIFEQLFTKPVHTKTKVTSTNISDAGTNVTSEITINGTTVNTKETINSTAHTITLNCTCKSSNKGSNTITIKAYFMDGDKNVLDTKSATLTCTDNSEVSTNLTYTDTKGNYRSYRIEVQ